MPQKTKNTKTYKQMSDELNELLAWFDNGQPDLDEALVKYEEASKLIADMEKYLKTAETKVKKITASLK